ncbi:hypothetical protein BCR33DRAFT_722199 [Rhizoclosmatium globosum]|uniref:Uncharacterized protein n=1 Tax=Rhizoclosmatium globosum TaxID=329046 RepID=A0A1Y2BNQ7_9FUNG|nr:hypothetical protein BCR33DRAFT_722199 [Rhizoclosmatium globosum]|eukprot:ORY36389.1 hypothetical protein BCR33DRAFT_722199 [Rhizoclosmatium globosum]
MTFDAGEEDSCINNLNGLGPEAEGNQLERVRPRGRVINLRTTGLYLIRSAFDVRQELQSLIDTSVTTQGSQIEELTNLYSDWCKRASNHFSQSREVIRSAALKFSTILNVNDPVKSLDSLRREVIKSCSQLNLAAKELEQGIEFLKNFLKTQVLKFNNSGVGLAHIAFDGMVSLWVMVVSTSLFASASGVPHIGAIGNKLTHHLFIGAIGMDQVLIDHLFGIISFSGPLWYGFWSTSNPLAGASSAPLSNLQKTLKAHRKCLAMFLKFIDIKANAWSISRPSSSDSSVCEFKDVCRVIGEKI